MRSFFGTVVAGFLCCWVMAGANDPAARATKLLEPRPLSLPAGKYTVADFLGQLEKQTGNVVLDRRLQKSGAPIALAFDGVPFWRVLDKFAEQANCGWTAYSAEGVILTDATRRSPHVSYHGITRTALKRIILARDFEADTSTCTLQLDVAWEPRFQPFYLGVGPMTATFAKGNLAKERTVQAPSRGQSPVAGRTALTLEMHLPAPERAALATLEGSWKFVGPSKMLTFRFAEIKSNAALEQEEVSVRLTNVKVGPDRWLIEVQIDNPPGTPVFESFQSWLDNNRISLVGGQGRKPQTWLPEPNEAVLVETSRKAVVQYAFAAQGKGKPADWTLVYQTPGRIVELTVPYRFEDVPLR